MDTVTYGNSATGVRPKFMPKLEDAGIRLSPTIFGLSERFF